MASSVVHCLRLVPGDDVKMKLMEFCAERELSCAWIVTVVGSLRRARIRLANHASPFFGTSSNDVYESDDAKFEIVSLCGTISNRGTSCHLHIALADRKGSAIGGHVLDGCEVFTTCEVVLGTSSEITFERHLDDRTGFDELVVRTSGEIAEDGDGAKGKRGRRARQEEAARAEREEREARGEKEPVRGLFGWIVNVIAPEPRRAA